MTDDLRRDLIAIILEEAYGYKEAAARRIAHSGSTNDRAALDAADTIVNRFDARCSRIEG